MSPGDAREPARAPPEERRPAARVPLYPVVALLLLAGLGAARLEMPGAPVGRSDQAFFYQIARNVAEGAGLRTSVSLYEKGLRELPAPTTVYPLWPLVLGVAGRWIGLDRAAVLLPTLLYFADLLLLAGLARRVGREVGSPDLLVVRGRSVLDVGTAAMALLGCNAVFFAYTSEPWTEGLAFALLFASLGALAQVPRRPVLAGALAGLLAGLAYLTRSQLLGVPLAIVAALAWAGRGSAACRRAAPAALAAAALPVLAWVAFLAASVDSLTPRMLVDFTAYRETPALPAFDGFARGSDSVLGVAGNVLRSLPVALDPTHPESYVASFGAAVYAVPLAAAFALWRRQRLRRALASPAGALCALATSLAAVAALAPAHALHGRYPYEWFFHWRHGMPLILAIVVAIGHLAGQGRLGRGAALALVGASLLVPPAHPRRYLTTAAGPTPAEAALVAWLDAHAEPPQILTTQSRPLVAWSRATAHWTRCELPPERTRAHFAHLDIDYLVLYRRERRCPFVRGLAPELEPVRTFGPDIEVLRWRPRPDSPEPPAMR